jgi:hypothetical protein
VSTFQLLTDAISNISLDVKYGMNQVTTEVKQVTAEVKQVTTEVKQVTTEVKQVSFRLDTLEERSRPLSGHMKVSASNTDHGNAIYDSLVLNSCVRDATVEQGPTAIPLEVITLATESYNQKPRPHESQLVSLYTPYLMEVVSEVSRDLRLVNSECYPWIQCMSGHRKSDLKPDLFSAYHSLIEYLLPYENAPSCTVNRLFGKFVSWESRASIHCIWDGKWKIDMGGFGEKCKYLQISGEEKLDHNGQPLRLKGILFDYSEFWMIRSSGNTIVDVVKCLWCQSGSRQCLVDFLRSLDPWIEATNALCDMLKETVIDFSGIPGQGSAWVGSGANGRVFRLQSRKVIKVVVGKRSEEVEREYNSMAYCLNKEGVKDFAFPIAIGSYRSGSVRGVDYAGYMLACEGVQILPPIAPDIKKKLAEALYGLHANQIIHGDPRFQNALLLDGDVKWIDFRQTDFVTSKINRQRDVEVLFESLGGKVRDAREQITSYINFPSVENLCAVIC